MTIQEMLQEKYKDKVNRLKQVIFDGLGDMVNPDEIAIQVMGGGKMGIYLEHRVDVPEQMIADEWKTVRKGTEFEDVSFYFMFGGK